MDVEGAAQFYTPEQRELRAKRMYDFYVGPPERNLEQVGQHFGNLTKERVRQIFKQYGYPVRFPRPYKRTKEKA